MQTAFFVDSSTKILLFYLMYVCFLIIKVDNKNIIPFSKAIDIKNPKDGEPKNNPTPKRNSSIGESGLFFAIVQPWFSDLSSFPVKTPEFIQTENRLHADVYRKQLLILKDLSPSDLWVQTQTLKWNICPFISCLDCISLSMRGFCSRLWKLAWRGEGRITKLWV